MSTAFYIYTVKSLPLVLPWKSRRMIPFFFETKVTRDSDGPLTTVYRKPTPHWPVPCLWFTPPWVSEACYTTDPKKSVSYLFSSLLDANGYPSWLVQKFAKRTRVIYHKELAKEFKPTTILSYIKGVWEVLCRSLQQKHLRTVFKSDATFRCHVVRPKDALEPTKQNGVVFKIPCECERVYIGGTKGV